MGSFALLFVARQYILNPSGFPRAYPHPWLVWTPPKKHTAEPIETTDVTGADIAFEKGDPLVIEVVKGSVPNAFPFGITIGHSENNDVIVRHEQVSRFHAWLQDGGGKRSIADAGSKNGTFLNGRRLVPRKAEPLGPEETLCFGKLEVRFFEPARFTAWLEELAAGKGLRG